MRKKFKRVHELSKEMSAAKNVAQKRYAQAMKEEHLGTANVLYCLLALICAICFTVTFYLMGLSLTIAISDWIQDKKEKKEKQEEEKISFYDENNRLSEDMRKILDEAPVVKMSDLERRCSGDEI